MAATNGSTTNSIVCNPVLHYVLITFSTISIWCLITAFFAYRKLYTGTNRWLSLAKCSSDIAGCAGLIAWNIMELQLWSDCNYLYMYASWFFQWCWILQVGFTFSVAFHFPMIVYKLFWNPSSTKCLLPISISVSAGFLLLSGLAMGLGAGESGAWDLFSGFTARPGNVLMFFQRACQAVCTVIMCINAGASPYKMGKFLLKSGATPIVSLVVCAGFLLVVEIYPSAYLLCVSGMISSSAESVEQRKDDFLVLLNVACSIYFPFHTALFAWMNKNFRRHFRQVLVTCYGIRRKRRLRRSLIVS